MLAVSRRGPCAGAGVAKTARVSGIIERYRDRLPVTENTPVISLGEGNTPLIEAPRLAARLGHAGRVLVKFEGLNPTGSFKDRGMTMAISKAAEAGAKAVVCASTGNTSAAAAAYAMRAGMQCLVLLPAGKIAQGKLAQAFVLGAKVVQIEGNFDDALDLVRQLGERGDFAVVNSINPYRIEGQKTLAFEVVDELGDAPHLHALPTGNAGNITAHWQGYREYFESGPATRLPRMLGVQAAGAAPLVLGHRVEQPETVATAIRIGNPASAEQALSAAKDSGGAIDCVEDQQILEAQAWLAANEGIFVEPASAASIAGLIQCFERRENGQDSPHGVRNPVIGLDPAGTIVCTVTGNGLKDIDAAAKFGQWETRHCAPTLEAVLGELG